MIEFLNVGVVKEIKIMMYDDEYYKNLNLDTFADQFDHTDPNRAKNNAFGDAVHAFVEKSELEEINVADLLRICGQPDELFHYEEFDIWIYLWYGMHGPDPYFSLTPFKVQSETVHFLGRDECDLLNIDILEILNKHE